MTSPRLALRGISRRLRLPSTTPPPTPFRKSSTTSNPNPTTTHDPHTLLSQPTWSVRSLLEPPPPSQQLQSPSPTEGKEKEQEEEITEPLLHHLLRLSALPPPTTPSETTSLLQTLKSQLHFVRHIQSVPTDSVAPLSAIRDETSAGLQESAIGLDDQGVKTALDQEVIWGRCKRPRRRRKGSIGAAGEHKDTGQAEVEEWDVLGMAQEKVGRYFVVRSGSAAGPAQAEGQDEIGPQESKEEAR
ncbi:hypothetical protein VTJ04DRAFT_9125 [Mycothermus thermophilus]|uniref:uncharacterized protein n=1 Tax=Humicola insolens TaxID=85995 RepID=UPI003743FA1C